MNYRYRLIRRSSRGGTYYCVDTTTGKRTSLRCNHEEDARQIVHAKIEAERQPRLNLQIAKAYLAGADSGSNTRTWQQAIDIIITHKRGANRLRWERASPDPAFDLIRHLVIVETRPEQLLRVLRDGTVSTNVFLRQIHNFCLDMNWLLWPQVPRRQWPPVASWFPGLLIRVSAGLQATRAHRRNADVACSHYLCAEALGEVLEARASDGRGRKGDRRGDIVDDYSQLVPAKLKDFSKRPAAERRHIQSSYPDVDLPLVRRALREKILLPEFASDVLEDEVSYRSLVRKIRRTTSRR